MYVFYFLAAVSIWVGLQSLRGGIRYARYVRLETSKSPADFFPFVSVIAPGRGLEDGLIENVRALLNQNYPSYEVLFVFDREDDPAAVAIGKLTEPDNEKKVKTRTVIAGPATDSGQKVHNLRVAVDRIDSAAEVLVFVDTDARPSRTWLRQLVAPLADKRLGASSGYRWFVPLKGNLASRLRAIWNASVASALGENQQKNFCWGGSTAIRRQRFEELNVRDRWRGSVSDDFTLTKVLHEAQLPIHYSPNCLVPSIGDCNFRELLTFTTRQIQITRVYATHLWKPILLGGFLFTTVFFGGWLLLIVKAVRGQDVLLLLLILSFVFLLGAAKSFLRWRAVKIPLVDYRRELIRDLWGQLFLWPFASLLYLHNAIVASFSRRIRWRGITYELKSPVEAVIIQRDS